MRAANVVAFERPALAPEPCGVTLCPANAADDDGFCAVHRGAKCLTHVMSGARCVACGRLLEVGQWITRESTLDAMTHACCPPKRIAEPHKKNRPKPLFDAMHAADVDARDTEIITSTDVGELAPVDVLKTEL
jgi:hypothetical protein